MKELSHREQYEMMVYETTHHSPPDSIVVDLKYEWLDQVKKEIAQKLKIEDLVSETDIRTQQEGEEEANKIKTELLMMNYCIPYITNIESVGRGTKNDTAVKDHQVNLHR